MDTVLMITGGGLVFVTGWVLYVMFWAIAYGALAGSCGISGLYLGSCVPSEVLFYIGDIGMTSTGLIACCLLAATLIFGSRFWEEAKKAGERLADPFGRKTTA